jgi:hypothetical protein
MRKKAPAPARGAELPFLSTRRPLPEAVVDEGKLLHHGWIQDKRVGIVQPHAAIEAVEDETQRMPVLHDGGKIGRSGMVHGVSPARVADFDAVVPGGFEGVGDVQVVGPGLGPVFPGVHRRIGRDVASRPVARRTVPMMPAQGLAVVETFVPEDRAKGLLFPFVRKQAVPEVMPGLVAEVAQQGAVDLAHIETHPLAHGIIGLRDVDRDDPPLMSGEDSPVGGKVVVQFGEEPKGEAPRGIVLLSGKRQPQVEEGVEEASFRRFHLGPQDAVSVHREIGDDLVEAAGEAVVLARFRRHHPVAHILGDVVAAHLPPLAPRISDHREMIIPDRPEGVEGELPRGEPQRVAAGEAAGVLEKQPLATVFADEGSHGGVQAGRDEVLDSGIIPPVKANRCPPFEAVPKEEKSGSARQPLTEKILRSGAFKASTRDSRANRRRAGAGLILSRIKQCPLFSVRLMNLRLLEPREQERVLSS